MLLLQKWLHQITSIWKICFRFSEFFKNLLFRNRVIGKLCQKTFFFVISSSCKSFVSYYIMMTQKDFLQKDLYKNLRHNKPYFCRKKSFPEKHFRQKFEPAVGFSATFFFKYNFFWNIVLQNLKFLKYTFIKNLYIYFAEKVYYMCIYYQLYILKRNLRKNKI